MGVKGTLAFGFLGDYFFCFLWLKFEDFSHQESMHFFYLNFEEKDGIFSWDTRQCPGFGFEDVTIH